MKYLGLLVTLLFTVSMTLFAQNTTSATFQQRIQGCLSGSPHNYVLTTHNGTTHMLIGDDQQLGAHVGQEVRLAGRRDLNRDASASSDEGTAHGMRFFRVENILQVQGACRK
jgi:hypothetical protein